ncbi:hypothetical protein DA482_04695 [Pseudomonas fluorescens]|nr:hypothetical protein B0A76_20395 [Pseudomonas fluorescens]RFP93197.1 hypothetical protein D0N73_27590 [Pseudomonas fluorescens]
MPVGVNGSAQALTRLKAKVELAVADVLQHLSQQPKNELGVVIGRSTIATPISRLERDTYNSSGTPRECATEKQVVLPETTSQTLLKGACRQ